MTPRNLALGSFGALSAVLLAVIALELSAAPAPPPRDAAPVRVADLPTTEAEDVSGLVPTILARPLFARDRRPSASAAAAGASDQMPRLAGILIDRGQKRAIFQPEGDAKPISVAEGEQVAGWQVKTIAADGVTLAGPKGTETVQPKPDPALAAAAATAQPLPGAPGQPNPRQYLPGGMQLPPGVPNPFNGQPRPVPGRPNTGQPGAPPTGPQPSNPPSNSRQPGSAPAAPNRR